MSDPVPDVGPAPAPAPVPAPEPAPVPTAPVPQEDPAPERPTILLTLACGDQASVAGGAATVHFCPEHDEQAVTGRAEI
jgi:hypothetical protein